MHRESTLQRLAPAHEGSKTMHQAWHVSEASDLCTVDNHKRDILPVHATVSKAEVLDPVAGVTAGSKDALAAATWTDTAEPEHSDVQAHMVLMREFTEAEK